MSLSFPALVSIIEELINEESSRNLYDSEIISLQCAWEGIDYQEFVDNQNYFLAKYLECYSNPGRSKTVNTLMSSTSRVLKFIANKYNTGRLTRKNFRRIITNLYNEGVIKIPDLFNAEIETEENSEITIDFNNSNCGREFEFETLLKLIQSKNIISIWGQPGIGKTFFVKEFAKRCLFQKSFIYLNSEEFQSIENLLKYVYLKLSSKEPSTSDIEPLISELFRSQECILIVDSIYDIHPDFRNILLSLSSHSFHSDSAIILVSRSNSFQNYNFPNDSFYSYQLKRLQKDTDYDNFLVSLGLDDKNSWPSFISMYEGNFRELTYVAKFIREIFAGSTAQYLQLGSSVLSPTLSSYLESIQFTEADHAIFDLFKNGSACMSINFFKFLKEHISTSEIFSRIAFLESHGFLMSKKEVNQVYFYISPLLKAYLKQEEEKLASKG